MKTARPLRQPTACLRLIAPRVVYSRNNATPVLKLLYVILYASSLASIALLVIAFGLQASRAFAVLVSSSTLGPWPDANARAGAHHSAGCGPTR